MFRLLLAGDLHLGRASSHVGDAVRPSAVSCAGAWHALTDLALADRVDLVVLSGDLVDAADRYFEASSALRTGVERLGAAGIRTIAVAGNHDWNVLPRVAGELAGARFRLLGAGGTWERATCTNDGRAVLHVDGWSFPAAAREDDPLESYDLERDAMVPTLGVVHGDLDAPTSRYAPLDRTRLARTGPAAWLLGHVHVPGRRDAGDPGTPWLLYPGSLQAMDPGEPGAHGAWRVDVANGRIGEPELRPLSSVRYERVAVDLDGAPDGEAVETRVDRALHEHTTTILARPDERLEHLVVRLVLTGRTAAHAVAAERTGSLVAAGAEPVGRLMRRIDHVRDDTVPDVDLREHAAGSTPVSEVARLLLALAGDDAAAVDPALLVSVREELKTIRAGRDYAALASDADAAIDDASVRAALGDAARTVLGALAEQTT